MNILISVNDKYLDKAETMLFSARRNTDQPIRVFLMTHSLAPSGIAQLEAFLSKNDMQLTVVDVTHTALDDLPLGNRHFSIEMYYRLLAQFLLPADMERVLWLDADIVVRRDLYPFYSQDFCGKLLCACPDKSQNGPEIIGIKEKVGLAEDHIYFNSGVLLLNLAALRIETTQEGIVGLASSLADRLTYPDQDILNVLYAGRVKYCPWQKYNYQVLYERKLPAEMLEDIVILHYVGETKPWDYHYIWPSSREYYRVQLQRGRWMQTIGMHLAYGLWKFSFDLRKMLGVIRE